MTQNLDQIRALLRDFRQSPLSEFHVAVPDFECFLTRLEGSANPMGSLGGAELADEVSVAAKVSSCRAPHLGIVRAIRAVGDAVAKGEHIADLMALDRATPIYAEADGNIFEGLVEGNFVEFGQAIAAIH